LANNFIPLARPFVSDEEISAVTEVIKSGWWTTGPKVTEFEGRVAGYLGGGLYAVALNSATSGLFLALKVLGIGPGDEVIVPTLTFIASAHVVEWCGAKVVLCDIDRDSYNIDTGLIEKLITPRTKAIMPVHIAGYPCEMSEIIKISNKYGLHIVEDAAHAIGTEYEGVKIGNHGKAVVFSFYATKNLACGEGGMVVSKDIELIEKIRKLSYFGVNKQAFKRYEKSGSWYYEVEELGYKCNFDSIHAALGIAQLNKLDNLNKIRREIAFKYKEKLDSSIEVQKNSENHFHSYHLFSVKLPAFLDRDDTFNMLKEKNIGSSVHFIPIHKHPYYAAKFSDASFPAANSLYPRLLSLPLYPSLENREVEHVIESLNSIVRSKKI
jgi:dTDP-4-amino-4,6-dideoxygalactose transaminase